MNTIHQSGASRRLNIPIIKLAVLALVSTTAASTGFAATIVGPSGTNFKTSTTGTAHITNSADGSVAIGSGTADGANTIVIGSGKGAIAGEYRVLVTKIKATTVETDAAGRPVGAAKLDSAGHPILTTQEDLIPAIYKDRKKSPLTFTVAPGKNLNVNFDLKSDVK